MSAVYVDVGIIYTYELQMNNNPNLLKFDYNFSVLLVLHVGTGWLVDSEKNKSALFF